MARNLHPPLSKPHAHAHLHPHTPIPYTGSPLLLCLADIRLFFALAGTLPGIFTPLTQWRAGALDELYPSVSNIYCLLLHAFLLLFQSLFLLSLPFLIALPVWLVGAYFAAIYGVTAAVAFLLNGRENVLHSTVDLGEDAKHREGECWIFVNGVSVGRHWLQSNLDLLALTFRRPVTGVHNRTYGIVFDLLQCVLERDFLYATTDVRRSYVTIKASLLDPKNKKVILLLHSQGGLEGGMILDWLLGEGTACPFSIPPTLSKRYAVFVIAVCVGLVLTESYLVPRDVLQKLEIYTFGSAANHFNNPFPHTVTSSHNPSSLPHTPSSGIHIEHFAHTQDFVARWGVLHFSSAAFPNRYAGRVFVRQGAGHLMNMHYLGGLFPLVGGRVREEDGDGWSGVSVLGGEGEGMLGVENESERGRGKKGMGVRECSRLWGYRDGRVPVGDVKI